MDKIDAAFELYFVTALQNREFGDSLTPQDDIRAVQLTTSRVDVVKVKTDEVFCFSK